MGDGRGCGPVAIRGRCRDPDLKPRGSLMRSFPAEHARVCVEGSGFGRVDVCFQRVGVVRVSKVEEETGLCKRRDHEPPRCRSLERVKDGFDVVRKLFSPLVSDMRGFVFPNNFIDERLHLFDVHRVGRLVSHDVLEPSKHAQVERLCEMGRMWYQKHHYDVFRFKQRLEPFHLVASAPVQNEHGLLVEVLQPLSQSFPRFLDMMDENLREPSAKHFTRHKAVFGREQLEVLCCVPIRKNLRTHGFVLCDDGWSEA